MNFLLDRFPIETFNDIKTALELINHKVSLGVLTIASKSKDYKTNINHFFDRDVSLGIVTKNTPMILSRDEIKQASKYEGLAINVFARFDITQGNFSAQEMSSHYYELYNFWLYQIKINKIDFCFHHYVPHDPSSFVLYLVLKINQIPAVFFDSPYILNKYRMLSCSFQHRSLLLENKHEKSKFNFYDGFKEYQQSLLDNDVNSTAMALRFREEKKKFNIYLKYKPKVKTIFKLIASNPEKVLEKMRNYYFGLENNFFKISRNSWASKKNNMNKIQYYFFMKKLKLNLLLKYYRYEAKCINDINGEYVYFAMPAQPEASTLPTAIEFTNVNKVLKIIREAIPEDVKIVLKENPSIFETRNPYLSGVNYRSPDFYDELQKIPNLILVSTKKSSHELIKNAKLVTSINGTAIIEGIAFCKPAVTFGSNWFDCINGIHKFISIDKLKDFYKFIQSNKNLIKPLDSRFEIDKNMLVEIKKHKPYELEYESKKKLIKAFIYSIDKFKKIDNRKWDV
jgi:hypothetical protein